MLRRAMGKKKPEEMAKQRDIFVAGATNLGIDQAISSGVFNLMESFAEYGFNKSHSAAYGVLAYQTAYLKHYYPAEFMAAVLTSEMSNTDAIVFLIADCKDNFNLTVLPPSVNHSLWHFVASTPQTIIYGLGAVKGVGESAVASIVEARQTGEFKDFYDFCNRVDIKKVGKRALEALIKAGCFDDMAYHVAPHFCDINGQNRSYDIRGGLWQQLPNAMKAAEQNRQNKEQGTMDLFSQIDNALQVAPPLPDIVWSNAQRLEGELATLGLYLTGHPIDEYKEELMGYTKTESLNELTATHFKSSVWFAGLIIDVANFNNRIAISIDDGTARLEMSCYPDKYQLLKQILKVGQIALFKASIRESDDGGRLFVRLQNALSLTQARLRFIHKAYVKLHKDDLDTLNQLLSILKERQSCNTLPPSITDEDAPTRDSLPLMLYVYDEFGIARVKTNDRFGFIPDEKNLSYLKSLLGSSLVLST